MRRPKKLRANYKGKDKRKYYTKKDIFLSRMASILRESRSMTRSMFSQRVMPVIQLNTLMSNPQKVISLLERQEVELEKVPWLENGYLVLNRYEDQLTHLAAFKQGLFYILDLSSSIPAIALNPSDKMAVLDMDTATGEDTIHLSTLMGNKGRLVSNEPNNHNTSRLKSTLGLYRVNNAEIREWAIEDFKKKEPDTYDKILLNVPSSSEGLVYLGGKTPLRVWSIKMIKAMPRAQYPSLEAAFIALKHGGELIYTTNTLEPIENEGVVSQLLKKFPNADVKKISLFESDEFEGHRKYVRKGITHWNNMDFEPEVQKSYRIVPNKYFVACYIAKITKGS